MHAVLSTLRFVHPTSWADKGNYTCVAQNSPIAPSASSSTTISVIHEPIILNERSPEGVALAAADLGATVGNQCSLTLIGLIFCVSGENGVQGVGTTRAKSELESRRGGGCGREWLQNIHGPSWR